MAGVEFQEQMGSLYPTISTFIAETLKQHIPLKRRYLPLLRESAQEAGLEFIDVGGQAFVLGHPTNPDQVLRIYHENDFIKYGIETMQQAHDVARLIFGEAIPPATFFEATVTDASGKEVAIRGNVQERVAPGNTRRNAFEFMIMKAKVDQFALPLFFDTEHVNFISGKYVDTVDPRDGYPDIRSFIQYLRRRPDFSWEQRRTILVELNKLDRMIKGK